MAIRTGRVSVLVAHPNRLYRESLARSLQRHPRIRAAWCGERAVVTGDREPDVVIIDLGLPGRDGLVEARVARKTLPRSRVLMTGCSDLESDVLACVEAGASGLVSQGSSLDTVIDDLLAVADGKGICSPKAARALFSRVSEYAKRRRYELRELVRITPRELEVIRLIDEGLTNKEIAATLGICLQTVKNHVHSILDKLKLRRRDQAVRFAREHGLLNGDSPAPGTGGSARGY